MGEIRGEPPRENRAARFARGGDHNVLNDARRRTTLAILADRSASIDDSALAEAVWADENEAPPQEASDVELERLLLELYHCHLPKLEAAGLISREDGAAETHLTELPDPRREEPERVDGARPSTLEHPVRRAAVDALSEAGRPMDLTELAAAITCPDDPTTTRDVDRCVALHHVHLPRLDRVGIVQYDHAENRVRLGDEAEPIAGIRSNDGS
ncbi:DUF7344 domain-containing protein [Salinigranum sp. GCM10025319]|uniref:DUF7344 domain-containing protein n=1 Tax=Salinigranum sp. GCM10025319 TaxID=3252687 RepID=UPI003611DBB3